MSLIYSVFFNRSLVVHSDSRNLGTQVAEYYQKEAARQLNKRRKDSSALIETLKGQGREAEIQTELKKLNFIKVDKNLAFTDGTLFEDYMNDMSIVQRYAELNRKAIVREIVKQMKSRVEDEFTTIHNYIEIETMILRKDAISAKAGEKVLIPMNMRDGSLICIGKGSDDWNQSAPHGAGRLMSRSSAKERITLTRFKQAMDEIIANISDTVDIIGKIRPLYNFKAAE